MRRDEYVYGFGERLGKAITQKGMSDMAVSERCGLSKSAVCGYINFGHMPSCASLVKLARVLGVSTDYLLGVK